MNYFTIYNLPINFRIDLNILDAEYFARQKEVHLKPNLNLAEINKAYMILKDDFERAKYLLSLQQINIEDPNYVKLISSEELQEIYNDREIIEESTNFETLEEMLKIKLLLKQELITKLAFTFDQVNAEGLTTAVRQTLQLKYLLNIINSIKNQIKSLK